MSLKSESLNSIRLRIALHHDQVVSLDHRVVIRARSNQVHIERRNLALAFFVDSKQLHLVGVGDRPEAARKRQCAQQRDLPGERVNTRLHDGPVDRDALGGEFLDEDRHLRVLQVFFAVALGDVAFGLLRGEARHDDGADERERHGARCVDSNRALGVVLVQVQNFDVQQVVGTDAVILAPG